MKLTKSQQNDIDTALYFNVGRQTATEEEIREYLDYSEKGIVPQRKGGGISGSTTNPIIEGKRWRGIHMHEMYEPGILDGSMPYITILGGYDRYTKWWQLWKSPHNLVPRNVLDFMKKEMFKGQDAEIIEECYQYIKELTPWAILKMKVRMWLRKFIRNNK